MSKNQNMSAYIPSAIDKISNFLLLLLGEMKRPYLVIIKVKLNLWPHLNSYKTKTKHK